LKNNQSLSEQAIFLIIGRSLAHAVAIILPIVLVRIFNKNDYGTYRQIVLIYGTFLPLLELGFRHSIYYFYPRDKTKRNALVSNTFFLLIVIGFSFLVGVVVLKNIIIKGFHNPNLVSLLFPLGIYLLLMLGSCFFEPLLITEGRGKEASYIYAGTDLLRVILLIVFALLTKNLYVVIWGLPFVSFVKFSLFSIYLNKKYKISLRKIELKYLKEQLNYSYPFGLAQIVGNVGRRLDQYYLSYFLTPSAFAIYSVGRFRIPFLNLVFTSIGNLILPRIVDYQKVGSKQKIISLWHKAIKNLALVGLPCMIFCLIMSKEIITFLYTKNYSESVPIFMIFLFFIPAQITSWGTILRAYGATKFIFKANLVAFLASVTSGYLLIKYFGTIGGALSALLVFYINVWLQVNKGKELLKVSLFEYYPWKIIAKIATVSLLSGIPIFFLKDIFRQKFISILISFFIYSSFYIFLINSLKLFVLKEEEIVIKNFQRLKNLYKK